MKHSDLPPSWKRAEALLREAVGRLPQEIGERNAGYMKAFHDYLDHNELGLAWGMLKKILAGVEKVPADLLDAMAKAAEEMQLAEGQQRSAARPACDTAESERKALSNINKHGCHILQVMEEAGHPPFSYSIGIRQTLQKPDLCVIGLKEPIAKFVINEYYKRAKQGEVFVPSVFYAGFLEGFDVCFSLVNRTHYPDYFGWGLWFNGGDDFDMLQLIYPTTSGVYPMDPEATEDLKKWQPLLGPV